MPIDVSRNTDMNCPLNCNNMSIFDRDMTVLVKYPISLAAILDLVNFEHVAVLEKFAKVDFRILGYPKRQNQLRNLSPQFCPTSPI